MKEDEMIAEMEDIIWDTIQVGIHKHGYDGRLEDTLIDMDIAHSIAVDLFNAGIRPKEEVKKEGGRESEEKIRYTSDNMSSFMVRRKMKSLISPICF